MLDNSVKSNCQSPVKCPEEITIGKKFLVIKNEILEVGNKVSSIKITLIGNKPNKNASNEPNVEGDCLFTALDELTTRLNNIDDDLHDIILKL